MPFPFSLVPSSPFFFTWSSFVIFVQVSQEIFVAEEWVKDARSEARVEANLRAETNKALGAVKHENKELAFKLTVEERARRSAKAGLKNVHNQAEDQRKKLYLTEIELAIQKQLVLDLKAKLKKAKTASLQAEEATKASRQASYNLGVEETEIRLAEELPEVCKDYCKEMWTKALNLAGVPADLEWR